MKGVIYTRVSSDEQVKGTSLDCQEELCRNYCQDKNIEVLAVFREEGASAKSADRAEFLRAIEFCRKNKGKVDAFVVAKVDRFARNTEDHFYIRKILLDYGVTLHSVSEPIGNSPVGKFFETMLAGSAEFDNAIRKQRCTDGMVARIKQGIYPWKPPIGYICSHFKKRGEKKTAPDPLDEKIFPIIQRALREYAKGLYSQIDLVGLMDKWGLKDIRGKKTTAQFANTITGKYLNFYAGIIINPWTGEEIKGQHIPIITKEERYQIQLIRAGKRKVMKWNRYNPDFPLRRTVICGHCGKSLTGSSPRGRSANYPYYHCYNKKCPMSSKSTPKENLEKEFVEYLGKIRLKEKFLAVFKESVLDLWQENGKKFELEAKQYEKRITLLEAKKKRIYEMREENTYTTEEFLERKAEIENQITATRISLNETNIEQFDLEGALIYATNFIRDLGRQWFDLSFQLRPRFQKLVFPEGIPYKRGEGFGTAKLGRIYETNQICGEEKSRVVDRAGLEPATFSMPWRRSTN
jgi:site-specific DNA recombinase